MFSERPGDRRRVDPASRSHPCAAGAGLRAIQGHAKEEAMKNGLLVLAVSDMLPTGCVVAHRPGDGVEVIPILPVVVETRR